MAESWKSLEQCPVFQRISGIRYSVYSVGNNIGKQKKKEKKILGVLSCQTKIWK